MHIQGPHVIQVEFMMPTQGTSPDEIYAEVLNAGSDGVRAKVVVRFRDTEKNKLTQLALDWHAPEAKVRAIEKQVNQLVLSKKKGWALLYLKYLSWTMDRLHKKRDCLRKKLFYLAQTRTKNLLSIGTNIAIEDWSNTPFRMVTPEERHELYERVVCSNNALFFIYSMNNMLSEEPGTLLISIVSDYI